MKVIFFVPSITTMYQMDQVWGFLYTLILIGLSHRIKQNENLKSHPSGTTLKIHKLKLQTKQQQRKLEKLKTNLKQQK